MNKVFKSDTYGLKNPLSISVPHFKPCLKHIVIYVTFTSFFSKYMSANALYFGTGEKPSLYFKSMTLFKQFIWVINY